MILTCNSCGKKFVVPDSAIKESGRIVQCGSCGNKWRQFPAKNIKKTKINLSSSSKPSPQIKTVKKKQFIKLRKNKKREINLYSPEYLAKKHGININEENTKKNIKSVKNFNKVSFGFYNAVILFTFLLIIFSRLTFFFQDFIIEIFPSSSFYLNYFFESLRNIFEIVRNLITNY